MSIKEQMVMIIEKMRSIEIANNSFKNFINGRTKNEVTVVDEK